MFKLRKTLFILFVSLFLSFVAFAQNRGFPEGAATGTMQMNPTVSPVTIPNVSIQVTEPRNGTEVAFSVRVLILLTVLTLAPSILILMTCFLRFSLVLDFIKRALSLQQVPPTAVLNGIAFFMTVFVMWPTFTQIYNNAYKPMADGNLTIEEAFRNAEEPLRNFMAVQLNLGEAGSSGQRTVGMFRQMARLPSFNTFGDVPTYILIPSYILNELTIAFKIGILLYIPFIIIDMVVASILMSMGMMMLPPVQISMPFKLMLFVLVDGWGLLTQQLFVSVLH